MIYFFSPLLLILNCIFIYFFRRYIGPMGIFITSTVALTLTLTSLLYFLSYQLTNSVYWFVDFGKFIHVHDILDSQLVFLVDPLGLTSAALVITLTVVAQYFGVEYMYREASIIRLVYLLNFFATSVVFLFFVYDFFLVLIVWELIGLFSLLLVNFYASRLYTVKAAFKTYVFSRFSDFFIFIVFFFFTLVFNSTDLSILFLKIPFFIFYNIFIFGFGFNLLNLISLFLAIAGSVKAAQFSFHVWLPDAMEAPTPASALIHSSTLVIMGIFLVVRFNVIFEFSYLGNIFMAVLGALTIALGAISASFQNDIKKLVAYSTVSQMGYLFCGCGFLAYREVMFYLAVHAMNKAFLFILVGYIVHFFNGNTDLRFMGSLYPYSTSLVFTLTIVSLNLTGLPATSGFVSKEFLVFQTFRQDPVILIIRTLWLVSFFFTPFYMLFLNWTVSFKNKQNFIIKYNTHNDLPKNKKPHTGFLFKNVISPLVSKSTVVVLFIFFWFVNYFGEYFIFVMFNYTDSINVISTSGYVISNNSYITPNSLSLNTVSTLNFLIMVSTASAIRYLRSLV